MHVGWRWIAVFVTAIGLGMFGSANAFASDACPGDDQVPTMDSAPQAAAALVCDLNAVRAQNGLPALNWDWNLWYAAQMMANDMSAKHYVSHQMPDGRTLLDRVLPTGYTHGSDDWILLENLGWTTGALSTPAALTNGWMNSEGHRVNILDPEIRDLGVGMQEGSPGDGHGDGMFYVVDFGAQGTPPLESHVRAVRTRGRRACTRRRRLALSGCAARNRWAHI